jgi:glycosyltransferase involved in cell wall biosynthesis
MNRFIAVQTGARRNYAIPSILENAGMLEAFYTDMCANAGLGKLLDLFCPSMFRKGGISRLLNRRVPANIRDKVYTADWATFRYLQRQQRAKNNQMLSRQALNLFNQEFGEFIINQGMGESTHIFSMFGEGTSCLEFAKTKGIKIVTEVNISPLTHRIVQEEKKLFPSMEPLVEEEILDDFYAWVKKVCQLTDIFIVPSNFVLEGLKDLEVNCDHYYIIPYAVDNSWLKIDNQPKKGRVLFVGTAELRKGIHILGIAAQKLGNLDYEFRVAGGVYDVIKKHELTQKLNFLGRITRANIKQEFSQADIFVLPSLAEGSAEVTYEALATGLPIITTEATGSVITDGVEGFIIPEKNPDILAEKIKELIENRDLRNHMAQAAKKKAKEYTWTQYSEKLLSVLATV